MSLSTIADPFTLRSIFPAECLLDWWFVSCHIWVNIEKQLQCCLASTSVPTTLALAGLPLLPQLHVHFSKHFVDCHQFLLQVQRPSLIGLSFPLVCLPLVCLPGHVLPLPRGDQMRMGEIGDMRVGGKCVMSENVYLLKNLQ